MKQFSFRYVFLFAILIATGIAVALIATRPTPAPPRAADFARLNTYLIDVAGWYEITPNESAVATPLDLTIDGLKALPDALGRWTSSPIQLGTEVDQWFENPDLALSSIYRDARGHQLWFSAFGSRRAKSYVLFEHTPITSYPAAGWTLVESGVIPILIGDKSIRVQRAILAKDGERRIVFYWYLWSDFDRDPEQGVLTMRLHIPAISTDQDAFDAGADFLRALFPQVVTWKRF
ncbi:MAG: exosortase C-terminal domain/associated protein EpsI [Chloroflexota bacterium]